MLRRQQGQSAAETTLVISMTVIAVVAASTTLVPLFSDGVQNLGADAKAILETGSVGGRGGSDRNAPTSSGGIPGTDPSAGPEDRANANRAMNPDSQRVGDATGVNSPREYASDRDAKDALERRTGNRYDNIGQLDQRA